MKIFIQNFIILLSQLFSATVCTANSINIYEWKKIRSAPHPIKQIIQIQNPIQSIDRRCFKLYSSGKVWILERHCTKNKSVQGIYVFDALGIRKFNWYDKQFSHWAWQEGCSTKKECYYKVTLNNSGEVTGFIYYYSINQSAGFYKIKIKDNRLIITKEKAIDLT